MLSRSGVRGEISPRKPGPTIKNWNYGRTSEFGGSYSLNMNFGYFRHPPLILPGDDVSDAGCSSGTFDCGLDVVFISSSKSPKV